jgi:hypothetical protein
VIRKITNSGKAVITPNAICDDIRLSMVKISELKSVEMYKILNREIIRYIICASSGIILYLRSEKSIIIKTEAIKIFKMLKTYDPV